MYDIMSLQRIGGRCAVLGCENYKLQKDKKSFFRMPKDRGILEKWIAFCNRTDLAKLLKTREPASFHANYSVCSDHFEVNCFRNKNLLSQGLLPGSIPTLKPTEHKIDQFKQPTGKALKFHSYFGISGPKCSVFSCTNFKRQRNRKSFFRMPKDDRELLKKWVAACSRKDLKSKLKTKESLYFHKNHTICSDHFEPSCFRTDNRLQPGSIPTLNLRKSVKIHYIFKNANEKVVNIRSSKNNSENNMLVENTIIKIDPDTVCVDQNETSNFLPVEHYRIIQNDAVPTRFEESITPPPESEKNIPFHTKVKCFV